MEAMRWTRFSEWSVFAKVLSVSVIAIMLLAGLSIGYLVPLAGDRLMEARRREMRDVTEMAMGMAARFHERAQRGELSEEDAKKGALEAIRGLRYGGGNYVWINDMQPRMLMHPIKPEMDGKDLAGDRDPRGKPLFLEMVETCRKHGQGDVAYMWPRPGSERPVDKVSHVRLYQPWGWVFGTGVYVDDVAEEVASMRWKVVGATMATALLVLLLGVGIARTITVPLDRAVRACNLVSEGDLSVRDALDPGRKDELGVLMRAIQRMADNIAALVRDVGGLSRAAKSGQLSVRADASTHRGDYRRLVEGVNETLDAVVTPLRTAADHVERIAHGDIPPKITAEYQGDFNTIRDNLNRCIDAVNLLIADANRLSAAAVQGHLSTRADVGRHEGDFRRIVQGMNDTLDAVVGPLSVAAGYIERISRSDIPEKITAEYRGDFHAIKTNLNTLLDILNGFTAEMNEMARKHAQGETDAMVDEARFAGPYRAMAKGINDMVKGHIAVGQKVVACVREFGQGNFEAPLERFPGKLAANNETIEQVRANLKALIRDSEMLVQAAAEGKLATRADATRHPGDFKKIVQGFNSTLDHVLNPINEASAVLERLANCDLRARMKGSYSGDHARMKTSVNRMADSLHDALLHVAESTSQVSSASEQIASSSQTVSTGATQQASALEETSSTLEQMSATTQQNTQSTLEARRLAEDTRRAADRGNTAMSRMVEAMGRIRSASEDTSTILADINEIAFQTNLLALNAAVEAARAGDAGRGFAVVAEEVRNLALRSKEAAKKTDDLIKQSMALAGEGEAISHEVHDSLNAIVSSVAKVTDIVAEIAEASQEQTRSIEQVNRAVSQIEQVVQQAAANSEETSSAAEQLAAQARELDSLVSRFQLSGGMRRTDASVRTSGAPAASPAWAT
jgi:methyl-accepting chemotaxis protein